MSSANPVDTRGEGECQECAAQDSGYSRVESGGYNPEDGDPASCTSGGSADPAAPVMQTVPAALDKVGR